MVKKRLAATQTLIGLIGIVLVVVSYVAFSGRLLAALGRIDRVAVSGEFQLEQSADLLTSFKDVAAELEASTIAHRRTVGSAIESTDKLSKTIGLWESDAIAFAKISRDASQIVDSFQQQLPITVPTVNVSTRPVRFQRPEVILETEDFIVKYPTITVETRTESIDLGVRKIDLKYPVGISTKEQNKKVRIADIPKVTLVDEIVDVPRIEVSQQIVLKSEKALLLETSKQFATTSDSLTTAAGSLADLRALMAGDLSDSLRQTKGNLTGVSRQLRQLQLERIPSVITKLDDQRRELHDSRVALSTLPYLVHIGFFVLGLIPLSVLLGGLGNFFSVARATV
jgi:hypothetical protein